jgi:hypothetical protein
MTMEYILTNKRDAEAFKSAMACASTPEKAQDILDRCYCLDGNGRKTKCIGGRMVKNPQGGIDVEGPVRFYNCRIGEIPFGFERVKGCFIVSKSDVKTLKNTPIFVEGSFDCCDCPKLVKPEGVKNLKECRVFWCYGNRKLNSMLPFLEHLRTICHCEVGHDMRSSCLLEGKRSIRAGKLGNMAGLVGQLKVMASGEKNRVRGG